MHSDYYFLQKRGPQKFTTSIKEWRAVVADIPLSKITNIRIVCLFVIIPKII